MRIFQFPLPTKLRNEINMLSPVCKVQVWWDEILDILHILILNISCWYWLLCTQQPNDFISSLLFFVFHIKILGYHVKITINESAIWFSRLFPSILIVVIVHWNSFSLLKGRNTCVGLCVCTCTFVSSTQHFHFSNGINTNLVNIVLYQGTAAGGTMEIVVNGTTGWLHQAGKEGVTPLAENIVKMATHVERRLTMGKKGYERVKERFMEHHMSQRIALVLKEVLRKSNSRT